MRKLPYYLLASLLLLAACKKEVETIVVQDKQYSWTEIKYLINYQRNVIRLLPGTNTLNLQEISRFEVLSPIVGSAEQQANGYYTGFGHTLSRTWFSNPMPWDVRNAVPMNANFYANPGNADVASDTVLTIYPTRFLDIGTLLRLHKLDPTATQFDNQLVSSRYPFGVINRNDYMLCGYHTSDYQEHAFRLVLTKLTNTASTGVTSYGPGVTYGSTQLSSQLIRIPTPDRSQYSFKTFWAVDDYFLVWCDGFGLFKVNQDGTYAQVNGTFTQATGPVNPTAVYKRKGTVYAFQNGGTIWTSTNDCASWQRIDGFSQALNYSTFYPVGDSLVGITHGIVNNSIYTFKWLNASNICLRELKSDGLGHADFADLAQLGDTVYLGTTGGLYKRPLSKFFESK